MALVLIIDDEYGIAELIEAVLTDEGHHVRIAANGKQGLDALATDQPDLIFLDYMMPVMDGAAVLRGMADGSPKHDGVPVVMMSSLPEVTVAKRCQGYAAFLRKPFRIGEIVTLTDRFARGETPPAS